MTPPLVGPGSGLDPRAPSATVLVVCTGNVCRSPAAELLLADRLGESRVAVASAGTRALVGRPVHEPMAELLSAAGLQTSRFVARDLAPQELREADLVLTMSRAHRTAVATTLPAAVRRTFLLVEAADIAAAVAAAGWPHDVGPGPAARLAALPALAGRYRRPVAGELEVPDPYRRPMEEYRRALAMIESAVDRLALAVGSITPAGAPAASSSPFG